MSRKKRSRKQSPRPAERPSAEKQKMDPHPPRPSLPLLAMATALLVTWLGFLLVMVMTT